MLSKRKKGLLLAFLLTIPLAWFWADKKYKALNPPEQALEVMEVTHTPYFLPQYIAINKGFFKEEGLSVHLNTTSREAARKALTDQRADIILCSLTESIFTLPPDKKPLPRAFAALTRLDGSFLLTRKKDSLFQWADLKEKTIIGDAPDSSAQVILEEVLRSHGLEPYRHLAIYQNIPTSLRLEAFHSGTGDYLLASETNVSIAEAGGYGHAIAAIGATGGEMPVAAYVASADYIDTHREVIQKFTNAIYKAQLWLQFHSAREAFDIVVPSFPQVDEEILLKSIERYLALNTWPKDPIITEEPYKRFRAAAEKAGELANPASYEDAVITDFARLATETVDYKPHTSILKITP
ncbi:MAG: ABC transporter substrate-binding protein [Peptococcaceae bacterium]|nr:MAG: ABC transporter substrate-binding protein [Peptococcaceae bacterium]